MREQISNAIRDAIIEGKIKAGDMIPEHDLTAQLGGKSHTYPGGYSHAGAPWIPSSPFKTDRTHCSS